MALYATTKGLDLPLGRAPDGKIADGPVITRVAVVGDDFPGIKPRLLVAEGDLVRRGQSLMSDRAIPGVNHTAPGGGQVIAINRGPRRRLQSIVIELSNEESSQSFDSFSGADPQTLGGHDIAALLVESGAWAAFRTRPFGKIPPPNSMPAAVFVTTTDTNPLAPDPEIVAASALIDFEIGLRLVAKLTTGPTYLCVRAGSDIAKRINAPVSVEEFKGPHPAGTAGFHIHCLRPVSRRHVVWTIGYQDVIAIGRLFQTGELDVSRIVSVCGPPVKKPRLVRTRMGASISEVATGEDMTARVRWISGSVLSGKAASGPVLGFLGRYDLQLSALHEDHRRELFGWCMPGKKKFSVMPVFVSRLFGSKTAEFTTSTHGSRRAMVPIGAYESVMPMDIMPTFLLRSIVVGDVERAEDLGVLELCEEDVALCTFVCPGKTDYGPALRTMLDAIEAEW